MPQNIFGTDGVRGVANADLSCDLAFRLGRAATKFLGPDICIGRDTRLSGTMLESALTAGIMAEGGRSHCCGVIPTPAVALLTVQNELDGGIVISASHNPPEFNGIKFFSRKGMKLPDAVEEEILGHVRGSHGCRYAADWRRRGPHYQDEGRSQGIRRPRHRYT